MKFLLKIDHFFGGLGHFHELCGFKFDLQSLRTFTHTYTLACCVRVVSMIIDATQDIMTILDGANFTVVLKKFKKPINKKGTYWLEVV